MNPAKRKADLLFSKIIRAKGVCEAEGYLFDCDGRLECAHWIPRRHSWTRTVEDNCFSLCRLHHAWFTNHPADFHQWALSKRGVDTYYRLRSRALSTVTFDWPAELARLRDIEGDGDDPRIDDQVG